MNKKNLVGLGAILSTIVSIFMWVWYANIPSFDQAKTSFNEENSTWQTYVITDVDNREVTK